MKRALAFAAVLACLLQPDGVPLSAQSDGPLKFLTNSFVTGDVVVGGVSLFRRGAANGFASQNIRITGVPPDAEILAAYLYIQTSTREAFGENAGIAGAQFKGHSLNTTVGPIANQGPIAKPLNWADDTQTCWGFGWNPRRRLVTYRADVLRFLDIGSNGKHIANGDHLVRVADAGRLGIGNDEAEDSPTMAGPRAVGASLVLLYRASDPDAALRSIVIYDGGYTKRAGETLSQRLQGFYQAAAVGPDAKMIHIVGDGQALLSERVQFDGLTFAANPFVGRLGPRWDNPTFALGTALKTYPAGPTQNTASVRPNGLLSDCLSWSAIVVSTKVQDTDEDGLLDIWESSTSEIKDPTGQPLPRLQQMGADPEHKDLFVEIGYLKTDGPVTYGTGADAKQKPAHSHLPPLDALTQVARAFAEAPVPNVDNTTGINVHFDVGSAYQTNRPDYIVPAGPGLGIGGRSFSETACANANGDPIVCPAAATGQYPAYPGTVGWKTGFRFYRDDVLKFSRSRKDIFRYALFVHALGIPKEENEFLPGTMTPNPAFRIPRTNTGVADWAGGDHLVAMGAFDDSAGLPVGTPFMQASTLMHEWGHNFGRRHGGDLFEPNCKPQYLSVMNYLYQLRGLLDANAVPRLDFNRVGPGVPSLALSETSLTDALISGLRYRMGWYAPKATSYLRNQIGGAATKHCDGSPLPSPDPNPVMVRVDATGLVNPIDWNADTQTPTTPISQDINFDGVLTALAPGADDWGKLRLNQVGSRRSIGGLFLNKSGLPTVGPLSLNAGKGDLGKGDLGKGDLGKGDLGKGDLGKGDLGKGDLGKGDLGSGISSITLGKGDLGKGDLGGGDLDVGSGIPGAPDQFEALEIDFEIAAATTGGSPTPPSAVQACLTTGGGLCAGSGGDRPVRLDWLAPNVGEVDEYHVYRFVVSQPFVPPTEITAGDRITVIGDGVEEPLVTTYLDTSAPAGTHLAYVVVARFTDGRTSGISNFATVSTPAVVGGTATVRISNEMAIWDGAPKPVTVTTTPPGLAVAVTYARNPLTPGTSTPPSDYGAYFVQATVTAPGWTGTASLVQTIASTLRAGGSGGRPANSFCEPGVFASGVRPSTNSYYGLLGYRLLCTTGDNPSRVAGPLSTGPPWNHTAYTEADAACGAGQVMVGVHGSTSDPGPGFGFVFLKDLGARCQAPGGGAITNVGPVGGGSYPGTPFSLTCNAGQAVTAVVGGVGEVADGVAIVCAPLPVASTITSVSPAAQVAAGFGQLLTINGVNLPGASLTDVLFNQGGADIPASYAWETTSTRVTVRVPALSPGAPTTVRVKNPAGTATTNAFPVTIATQPGTPVLLSVLNQCTGGTPIANILPGGSFAVEGEGIDTTGTTIVWTPVSAHGTVITQSTSTTQAGPTGRVCANPAPPLEGPGGAPAGLSPGTWSVKIRTQVGTQTSADSNAIIITVPSS